MTANRDAPLFQKELFPNIQIETSVNSPPSSPKTVTTTISIVNLKSTLVAGTLDRLFAHVLASVSEEMSVSSIAIPTNAAADIHFEIDIAKAVSQGVVAATTPGGLATYTTNVVRIANIDISIENLQVPSLASTFERIKTYMTSAVANDLNP